MQVARHGQLQEWLEDYEEGEVNHHHISHLYAVFPGNQITIDNESELAKAARMSIDRRSSPKEKIAAWPGGRITGLVARGGFEVDIEWNNGKLTHGLIKSRLGNTCNVRYGDKKITIKTEAGKTYKLDSNLGYK